MKKGNTIQIWSRNSIILVVAVVIFVSHVFILQWLHTKRQQLLDEQCLSMMTNIVNLYAQFNEQLSDSLPVKSQLRPEIKEKLAVFTNEIMQNKYVNIQLTQQPLFKSSSGYLSLCDQCINKILAGTVIDEAQVKHYMLLSKNKSNTYQLSVQLPDLTYWLNITVQLHKSDYALYVFLIVEAIIMSFLLLYIYWVNQLNRPISQLKTMLNRFGLESVPQKSLSYAPKVIRQCVGLVTHLVNHADAVVNQQSYMIKSLSHDVRTPLSKARMLIELEDNPQLADRVLPQLDAIDAFLQKMLDFSKNYDVEELVKSINLVHFMRTTVQAYQAMGYLIHFDAVCSKCFINARVKQLKQAFIHIIDNAVKYGDKIQVTMNTDDTNKWIHVTVADNGPGLPVAEISNVFSPFYRYLHKASKLNSGAGLGLTIAKRILTAHDAKITMTNIEPHGLSVIVRFAISSL